MKHHIYHHNDMDGHASGALVALALIDIDQTVEPSDIYFYEMNYGMDFDDSKINYKEDKIYMVDFSLQPFPKMVELIKKSDITWIDHHLTSCKDIAKYQENNNDELLFNGIVKEGEKAACELVWDYYYNDACPLFIRMLSHYDIWFKESALGWEDLQDLQLRLKLTNTKPQDSLDWWREMINCSSETLAELVTEGHLLKRFNDARQKKMMLANSYEGTFAGYKACIVNSSDYGSPQFEAAFDVDEYDLLVSYQLHKNKYWIVGLYSTNPSVDCGAIAKQLGAEGPFKSGGGHPGAAGFQTSTEHIQKLIWDVNPS